MSESRLPHVWGGGQLLAWSGVDGPTDYALGLIARTGFEGCTVEVVLPGRATIAMDTVAPRECTITGDTIVVMTTAGTTRLAFVDAHQILIDGPCRIELSDDSLEVRHDRTRTLLATAGRLSPDSLSLDIDSLIAQRLEFLRTSVARLPDDALSHAAIPKAISQLKTMICSPEGSIRHGWTTPDRWPHRQMWLWDSAFHAIGLRHIDVGLAADAIEAMLDVQAPDGQLPLMANPVESLLTFTQPPILAFAAKLVWERSGDDAWLSRIFPLLTRYVEWDLEHRIDAASGLPAWAVTDDVTSRSGESGMDNSPRFDPGHRIGAVDLASFLALECETLSELATLRGDPVRATRWHVRYRALCELIDVAYWDDDRGFYFDIDLVTGRPLGIECCSGLYPLVCGAAPPDHAERVRQAIEDPARFGTPFPVPTISAIETSYYAKDMWRGPVWINVNWLVIRGLERYGFRTTADAVRSSTTAEIERMYAQYGTMFEFYDDRQELAPPQLLRKGACAPEVSPYRQVFHDFGWTAALYLDLVVDDSAKA